MTTSDAPATTGGGSWPTVLLRAPWTKRTWLNTAHIVVGAPIAVLACVIVLSLTSMVAALAVTAVLAVPFAAALFSSSRVLTSWHQARFAGLLGLRIPVPEVRHEGSTPLRRLLEQARRPSTWRQIWYHILAGVTTSVAFTAVVGFWTAGILLSTLPLHGWLLPDSTVSGMRLHSPGTMALLTVLGLVAFFAAPWVARAAVRMDVAMAQALLPPSRGDVLAGRVASLIESRTELIDAADSERRRIERDLHDGTQQRLVSIAMNLGLSRTTLTTDVPAPVREAIEQAHEDAKLALSELRDVVRGLHPAVLDDLGLDAALSGIAARSPVPVRLMVELPHRAPRAVEAVAYFVVSEALTNVAKHAEATRVDIIVEQPTAGLLRIVVSDDGKGGVDLQRGTGLRGLKRRIGSVDGSLTIDSPPGGPTVLVVELPCVS